MYRLVAILLLMVSFAAVAGAYQYDPNDFATDVVEYEKGTIPVTLYDIFTGTPFTYPEMAALDRPTYITTGDPNIGEDVDMPVVPVYSAFRWWEIVTIGNGGGRLTLKFNHPVANDRKNPYGIDFIVFGNAQQSKVTNADWKPWSDPNQVMVGNITYYERGILSVSQDGQTWYTFTNGPYADDFAPTAGYRWDSANHCWGEELDPTKPVNPALTPASMNGKTVAQMIDTYDGSAGGTGFDIGRFGLEWILYVRIDDNPAYGSTTEIDAVSDVAACGDYKHPFPSGDLNQDCRVNMQDFSMAAERWMGVTDISMIVQHWLECTWNCE
jgi:hypothetical protein